MTERARSSVMTKQEALMKLMSSDPSLMSSFDDELLASITLASDPAASSSNRSASVAAAKHTLIDPRVSYRQSARTGSNNTSKSNGRASVRYSTKTTERVNVQLYSAEDEGDAQKAKKKQQILFEPSAVSITSSSANVTKKSEDATTTKDDAGRERSNAVTRESARYPQKLLVSLLDEDMFTVRGTLKTTPQAQGPQIQQQPLPPSIAPVVRTKSIPPSRKRSSNKNNKKANNRRRAQPAVPPSSLVSVEQQYEFGRSTSYSSGLDVTDQSAVESTHSSSHGSNESDESCIRMSSVSMQESNGANTSANGPPSSISRQKSSQMVLDHRCFVPRDQWVVKSSRQCCAVCERDFNVLVRKRHSCRMCGEVICSRCSVFRAVNLSVVEGKCRVCSCCSVSYRKKLEDLVANGSSNASSGVSSEPTAVSTAADRESGSMESSSTLAPDQQPSSKPAKLTASSLSNLTDESAKSSSPSQPSRYDSDLSTLLSCDYSSYSSASLSTSSDGLSSFSSFSSRNIEEELEAALKARQLEKEVEASRNRIQELEVKIQDQENQKELLSSEQQSQLSEARSMIQQLQEKLQQQELSAREAAVTRDTICLTNLRQIEMYTSDDEESRALKKKLKILERQLQQAGINVAEVIPYEVAKAKVAEIARRLQEIGSSELVLDDKQAQAAARKEYYKLEQDMEKYNTALVMTDEYIEEERRKEALFEEENREANERALLLLRSAIPVNISRLSEQQLKSLTTPSGIAFPPDLAKRLKRTNVLQLLRVDPKNIVRMHPSVIEGHRTTGLTLLERRALHVVMQKPFQEWKRQQMDEMSQKKFQWYKKLLDGLASAVRSYNQHYEMSSTEEEPAAMPVKHSCKLLGLSCPVRAEEKVEALYAVGLGFPQTDAYFEQEIIKSDPEGAGEKALQEAQSYAREMIANQRQRELKTHYKMNMREVAQAMGALEEVDAIMERIKTQDAAFRLPTKNDNNNVVETSTNDCGALLQASRELVLLLAKRAGICIVGKRNRENDQVDTRSPVELQVAAVAVQLLCLLVEDIREFHSSYSNSGSVGTLRYVNELLENVKEKNTALLLAGQGTKEANGPAAECKRVPWKERSTVAATETAASSDASEEYGADGTTTANPRIPSSSSSSTAPARPPAVLPTSASLFDAIRARKQLRKAESGSNEPVSTDSQEKKKSEVVAAKPVDLLAAIRARQCKPQAPAAATEGTTSA